MPKLIELFFEQHFGSTQLFFQLVQNLESVREPFQLIILFEHLYPALYDLDVDDHADAEFRRALTIFNVSTELSKPGTGRAAEPVIRCPFLFITGHPFPIAASVYTASHFNSILNAVCVW